MIDYKYYPILTPRDETTKNEQKQFSPNSILYDLLECESNDHSSILQVALKLEYSRHIISKPLIFSMHENLCARIESLFCAIEASSDPKPFLPLMYALMKCFMSTANSSQKEMTLRTVIQVYNIIAENEESFDFHFIITSILTSIMDQNVPANAANPAVHAAAANVLLPEKEF